MAPRYNVASATAPSVALCLLNVPRRAARARSLIALWQHPSAQATASMSKVHAASVCSLWLQRHQRPSRLLIRNAAVQEGPSAMGSKREWSDHACTPTRVMPFVTRERAFVAPQGKRRRTAASTPATEVVEMSLGGGTGSGLRQLVRSCLSSSRCALLPCIVASAPLSRCTSDVVRKAGPHHTRHGERCHQSRHQSGSRCQDW